jgi:aspartate kinase
MRELAYSGFTIFHDEALEPTYRANIQVKIKNTNNPNAKGTLISAERNNNEYPIVGIACSSNFSALFVGKYLLNRIKGFGRKLLQIIEEEGLSYEHCPSGIDSISVILRGEEFNEAIQERVFKKIKDTLQSDQISVKHGITLVMIVGNGMRKKIGIASRITSACAKAGVNLEMINQGASENSIMLGIRDEDKERTVVALHNEFFGNQPFLK